MKKIFSVLLVLIQGCASNSTRTHGIPNLALVEPGIWRGGQPNAEGWAWLKSQGVTYDVKLNTWAEASDAQARVVGIFIQDDGMIDFKQQTIGKPNLLAVESVQSIINKTNHPGIFIHCEHGQDRTGLIVGAYRVRKGWTKSDAYKEMIAHGFHPILHGLVRAWEEDVP